MLCVIVSEKCGLNPLSIETLQVVLNVGLCIALHDIIHMEDSFIFPGDGAAHTKVRFRYVVFRPFLEEVLVGKIRCCSPEGVHGVVSVYSITVNCSSCTHVSNILSPALSSIQLP